MEQNNEVTAIEKLMAEKGTPKAVFEGVKAANGWKMGKMVSEVVYDKAVEDFNKMPIDGRKVKAHVQSD